MDMPEYLPNETMGDYRKRLNLPHVYVPYFPGGADQVDWQWELQKRFPAISIYPYSDLNVGKANEMLVIVFEDESHITEMAREKIIQACSSYGRAHAEKTVPTLEQLKERYKHSRPGESL